LELLTSYLKRALRYRVDLSHRDTQSAVVLFFRSFAPLTFGFIMSAQYIFLGRVNVVYLLRHLPTSSTSHHSSRSLHAHVQVAAGFASGRNKNAYEESNGMDVDPLLAKVTVCTNTIRMNTSD